MSSEFSPELRKDLLDDFYAECDELLTSIRENFALLEQSAANGSADSEVVQTLFRNVHSLKGIAAIVGLRQAEELAHAAEDLLRGLSKNEIQPTSAVVETLLIAAQRLEQIVALHRLGKPLPEIQDVLESLRRRIPTPKKANVRGKKREPESSEPNPPKVDPVEGARKRGLHPWVYTFAPSAELDKRGVNVNAVRERLGRIGEILSASPSVRANGSIAFEFLVALQSVPTDLSAWEADGIAMRPVPAESSAAAPAVSPLAMRESEHLEALSLTPSHMVRVDLARLEDLMRITGEMVIHRFRLEDRLTQTGNNHGGLKEINLALTRSLRELRQAITRVRLVPIAEIFTRMPYVVRDMIRDSEKKARVVLEGHQTEIDKYLVERLKEPLLHLVRNALSHGIEPVKERIAAGKTKEATITLRATSEGESVLIEIRDDGRGMDPSALAQRALSLGIAVPDRLDSDDLLKILCTPGFSTREVADLASGRGVGMSVVANTVRELGGHLVLESWPGKGSVFRLRLPLTLSIAAAFIVCIDEQCCAVPQGSVDEILQVAPSTVRSIKGTEVIPYRDGLLPLVRLRKIFSMASDAIATLTILVLRSERGAAGLVVDRIQGQREIVVRPLSDPLLRVPGISGATELGNGRPILILDPLAITHGVVRPPLAAENSNAGAHPKQHVP